jgi:hypothetical protein
MKLSKALLATAAALLCAVGNANANAQTVKLLGIGSSALFLEMGQAAALSPAIGATCTWTVKGGSAPYVTDTRPGAGLTETGQSWTAWTPQGVSCSTVNSSTQIWFYLQTDSVIGNRCVFAQPACQITYPTQSSGAQLSLLTGVTDQTSLPTAISGLLNGLRVNVAGTDIRPEDGKFATVRALTDCGATVNGVAGSQYLGLGYATSHGAHTGNSIAGSTQGLGSSFHVEDFNLTGNDPITGNSVPSFNVIDVGAVPIVVFVNPADESGFGSLQVTNLTRATLAGYLDGTYGRAGDAIVQDYSASGPGGQAVSVFIREPLSGTYNTMEYAVPNNTEIQSSQDVGLNTGFAKGIDGNNPCSGIVFSGNLAVNGDSVSRGSGTSTRYRTIGTGNMIQSVYNLTDSLGYAFWSAANFTHATATNAKYLTIDGVDPLQEVWTDGLVPTSANGLLGNVSLANVKSGAYPIWSKLRIVDASGGTSGASALVAAAQNFISPAQPDFVPVAQLAVVRSHFAPPFNGSSTYNVNFPSSGTNQPANGDGPNCNVSGATPEAGGDVGGLVISIQADSDFCTDAFSSTGVNGLRQ